MKKRKKKMSFKDWLKKERKAAGLTQTALAKKAGLTPAAICNYEAGNRQPNYDALMRLADALNVSTVELVG